MGTQDAETLNALGVMSSVMFGTLVVLGTMFLIILVAKKIIFDLKFSQKIKKLQAITKNKSNKIIEVHSSNNGMPVFVRINNNENQEIIKL